MTNEVYVAEFMEQHLDQAADVLTRSFLELNTIWKNYLPSYEVIFPIMRGKLLPALGFFGQGWSYVLMKGDKVIGVSVEY